MKMDVKIVKVDGSRRRHLAPAPIIQERRAAFPTEHSIKGKEIFYRQVDLDVSGAYEVATEAMAETSQWPDAQERIKAFIEKRPPRYEEPDET